MALPHTNVEKPEDDVTAVWQKNQDLRYRTAPRENSVKYEKTPFRHKITNSK
jgi:hypothetical protein